jgi:hypothetical protein
MFTQISFPKNARIARRLLEASLIGGVEVDDKLIKLAMQDRVIQNQLPLKLSSAQQNAYQFIADRAGRCVLLSKQHDDFIAPLLSYVITNNKLPLMIVTPSPSVNNWIELCLSFWPDKKIMCYGKFAHNTKNPKITYANEGIEGFDIYITQPGDIFKGSVLKKTRLAHAIIDHKIAIGAVTAFSKNSIFGLATETYSTTIVLNILQCLQNRNIETANYFDSVDWRKLNPATTAIFDILYPSLTIRPFLLGENDRYDNHLEHNNISKNRAHWLPLLNICPHLVTGDLYANL